MTRLFITKGADSRRFLIFIWSFVVTVHPFLRLNAPTSTRNILVVCVEF
jgi:hypothetical protein